MLRYGPLALLCAVSVMPGVFGVASKSSRSILEAKYSFPIATDYQIFNLPKDTTNVAVPATQIQGQIYFPLRTAPNHSTPLAIMLSGKHADCREYMKIPGFGLYPVDLGSMTSPGVCPPNQTVVPGYRGFDYLGRALAAQGFAAISIDPLLLNNAHPVLDDPFLDFARARLLLKTLERVRRWDANATESVSSLGFEISSTINFSAIGLMGHSRGGDGVRLAYNMLMTPERLYHSETVDWGTALNASIKAVLEVAPFDAGFTRAQSEVVGAPWALVGAGCETDEVDYGYYKLVGRQSRTNPFPNHFLNLYGANHEYFNSEWHLALNDCLGDQMNTWNTSAPLVNFPYQGQQLRIPLVLGSTKQENALKLILLEFFDAYLTDHTQTQWDPALTRTASGTTPSYKGVEVGIANPNLASSTILQDFTDLNASEITTHPSNLTVSSLDQHAISFFPSFKDQVSRFGLPPTYQFLGVSANSPFTLAEDPTDDQGIVIRLPEDSWHILRISIPLQASKNQSSAQLVMQLPHQCSIQADVARRTDCFLPASANSSVSNRPGKTCATPRKLTVFARVGDSSEAGIDPSSATESQESGWATKELKSRFNVEFGPRNLGVKSPNATITGLLPIAWETVVMDDVSNASTTYNTGPPLSPPSKEQMELWVVNADRTESAQNDVLYIGPIRRFCL